MHHLCSRKRAHPDRGNISRSTPSSHPGLALPAIQPTFIYFFAIANCRQEKLLLSGSLNSGREPGSYASPVQQEARPSGQGNISRSTPSSHPGLALPAIQPTFIYFLPLYVTVQRFPNGAAINKAGTRLCIRR
ncbi:hypothetical protein CEXT_550741 [Caerostris extrusa]|uniref:Uncharacterized protein n=1 Tax=Caerostris extrusa TaxID=172846 RepID=A0AAV4TTE0_CAEEX|nr:hypothetical protein CEXT_550741 [Caerostris extrusa]